MPPHPEPSRLGWPRDASAASLSLNSSACALGYSTFSQPSAALLSGGGSEPAHQGAGHPDARREVRLRPPAHSSAAARTLSRAAVRACVVPTASAAAHRQRPWQESTPDPGTVFLSHSGALEVPPGGAPLARPPTQPCPPLAIRTARAPVASTASAASHRLRPWQESTPDLGTVFFSHSGALEEPSGGAVARVRVPVGPTAGGGYRAPYWALVLSVILSYLVFFLLLYTPSFFILDS